MNTVIYQKTIQNAMRYFDSFAATLKDNSTPMGDILAVLVLAWKVQIPG